MDSLEIVDTLFYLSYLSQCLNLHNDMGPVSSLFGSDNLHLKGYDYAVRVLTDHSIIPQCHRSIRNDRSRSSLGGRPAASVRGLILTLLVTNLANTK